MLLKHVLLHLSGFGLAGEILVMQGVLCLLHLNPLTRDMTAQLTCSGA